MMQDKNIQPGDIRPDAFQPDTQLLIDRVSEPNFRQRFTPQVNHDFIQFVPHLEAAGLPMLLNETVPLEKNGATIYLSGIDDPHFYETDNLHRARVNPVRPDQHLARPLA